MSNYVNDALLDASPYKQQQEEAKSLVNKWDKTGLLDGLNEDFQKSGMAVMLENQAKQLINENSATGGGAGEGRGASQESFSWAGGPGPPSRCPSRTCAPMAFRRTGIGRPQGEGWCWAASSRKIRRWWGLSRRRVGRRSR